MRYQLFQGIQLSVVGLSARQMVVLELGPLLTGLVLTGRVGARMTAEIGTMRVTEQIDALETLAYDPIAFLVVPRLLAALIMLPVLTIFADAVGIGSAWITSVPATDVLSSQISGRAAARLRSLPGVLQSAQGDHVRRGDRLRLLVRGLHHRSRRRGCRPVHGEGGGDRVRRDPHARRADRGASRATTTGMKTKERGSGRIRRRPRGDPRRARHALARARRADVRLSALRQLPVGPASSRDSPSCSRG